MVRVTINHIARQKNRTTVKKRGKNAKHKNDLIKFSPCGENTLRLILMRIRFRASAFGQVAKTNHLRANRNRLLVRNRMRRWCSGHLFVCSCYSAVTFWESEKPSQRRLLLCVWRRENTRRVHFARPWTQASKPALTDSRLAAKRRAQALNVGFFSTKHSSPAR